ncbi:SAM-dependent methyltransferase [Furfurilactobacillus curtus]|uniref:SAM-dependent methyltransferase n=1 Tax=Furfurilactobacillus curtus TaxID=1746200 RepID=A0ABQ5JVF4_9LACO
MNPKQRKKLKRQFPHVRQPHLAPRSNSDYITKMQAFREQFTDYSAAVFLINQVLEADRLLAAGLLPQPLPPLLLPDNYQDTIYQTLLAKYPLGDPIGDQKWATLSAALPKLDHQLRDFRDYLEATYGMWAYISAPFTNDLSNYLKGVPTLELMAGNGYISKGLRDHDANQTLYVTDSTAWTNENETGRHPVIEVEPLDALAAIAKYGTNVDAIIMSWSPDGQEIDWQVLQAVRQLPNAPQLIVIGEKGGATGSTAFWQHAKLTENADLNRHFHDFDLIKDRVYIVK